MFAIHKLYQFAQCPYQIYWAVTRRIFQYIKGTITFGICWSSPSLVLNKDHCKYGIQGHADSSKKDDVFAFSDLGHASNPTNQKSYQGVVFLVQGGVVAYKNVKQKSAASLSMTTKIAIWLRKMATNFERFRVTNLDRVDETVPILFGDNKASIQLKKGISNNGKIQHIHIAFHKVKDKSRKGTVLLQ